MHAETEKNSASAYKTSYQLGSNLAWSRLSFKRDGILCKYHSDKKITTTNSSLNFSFNRAIIGDFFVSMRVGLNQVHIVEEKDDFERDKGISF